MGLVAENDILSKVADFSQDLIVSTREIHTSQW